MEERACINCLWGCDCESCGPGDADKVRLICRRYPPSGPVSGACPVPWPHVRAYDYCGEFVSDPADVPVSG